MSTSISQKANIALSASAVLLLVISLAFYADFIIPSLTSFFSMLVIAFEFAVPVFIIDRWRESLKNYNIYSHGLEDILDGTKPDLLGLKTEAKFFLKLSLIILFLYILAYFLYSYVYAKLNYLTFLYNFKLPPNIFIEILMQIVVVAMPEEIFFRGFLQNSLIKKWPNRVFVLSIPVGRAIIITNILFALAHFVGGFNPVRLLTFFPGMIFSFLAYKNKSIFSAILFHALCNILAQVLYMSVFFG